MAGARLLLVDDDAFFSRKDGRLEKTPRLQTDTVLSPAFSVEGAFKLLKFVLGAGAPLTVPIFVGLESRIVFCGIALWSQRRKPLALGLMSVFHGAAVVTTMLGLLAVKVSQGLAF